MRKKRKNRRSARPGAEAPRLAGRVLLKFVPFAILSAMTLLLYSGSLRNPLVFDDVELRSLSQTWAHFGLRWVSYVTFGLTYDLAGASLPWHRLVNVLLHALTAAALFAFLRRLFGVVLGPPGPADLSSGQLAFIGALIFAVHPICVYGVAYLVQRSIVMATLFSLLSLLAYLEGLLRGGSRWFLGASALYFLAVFSKEHCVMLPAVAAALTLAVRKPSWSLLRELWLPFTAFLLIGLLVVFARKGILGVPYESLAPQAAAQLPGAAGAGSIYPLSVITECWLFFKYLCLWIVPSPAWLAVDLRQKFAGGFLSWPETAGFLAFMSYPVVATWLLLKRGRRGLAGFGLLFPWLLYFTELSTVRIQEPFVLYRAYLWLGGLSAVIPLISLSVGKRWSLGLGCAICLAMVPLAWNRLDSFSSAWKLWDDVVQKNPDRQLFLVERGYNKRGIASIQLGHYSDAIRDFTTSLEIKPGDPAIHLNRGMASMQLADYPAALEDFSTGLDLDPREPAFHVNRGIIHAASQRYTEAIAEFDRALELDSANQLALFNRGQALRLMSRPNNQ